MKRAFSIFAFTGFFISLLVHLSTFWGIDPAKHVPWVWALHLGIFVVFIPMVFAQGLKQQKDYWGKLFAPMPLWARYTVKFFFAYTIINFALFFVLSRGGVPDVRDGKYVRRNHGTVVRELTEDEYEWQKAYIVRGFSGHWTMFYLIPAMFFWYRKDDNLKQ